MRGSMHHLDLTVGELAAWRAESRADVERLHDLLRAIDATIVDAAADYPHYGTGYYAVFFADPDGLKLEFAYQT